jgi:hypothetical protein
MSLVVSLIGVVAARRLGAVSPSWNAEHAAVD